MNDIDYLVDLFYEMRETGLEKALSGDADDLSSKVSVALDKLEASSEIAKSLLTDRMTEEKIVLFFLMVQKMASTLALQNGDNSIMLAEMSGELQAYTHTVILSAIGTLIADEIL
jgi:hypothetical protein